MKNNGDDVKIRRTWKIDPVERIHSRIKKPKAWDIPADEDIIEQLEEWEADYLEGHVRDYVPDLDNLHIKK